jgi:shikimate kinase
MLGSGKTTIGKRLGRDLGIEILDLDKEIEKRSGVSISTIFEIEGEDGFRNRESLLVKDIAQCFNGVIATGGGVVLNPTNRICLASSGVVVYLHASPHLLYSRTRCDRKRPLIQVSDPLKRITELVVRRDPLYREVADVIVEAGDNMTNIVEQIKHAIDSLCRH